MGLATTPHPYPQDVARTDDALNPDPPSPQPGPDRLHPSQQAVEQLVQRCAKERTLDPLLAFIEDQMTTAYWRGRQDGLAGRITDLADDHYERPTRLFAQESS